ncbi:MAG: amino acid transporter [Actinobacteria bacterium]|nr:MAG: amino acid transporter [Actinomycetota bacterium]
MGENDLGNWEPLTVPEAAGLFADCACPWWIMGGLAIEAFVGAQDRRQHDDIDVGCLARDQLRVGASLPSWDLRCADPPGRLRRWLDGEILEEPVHDVWARERPDRPWCLQIVLNPSVGDEWIYRRDPRIRRRLADLVWVSAGVPYLVPEVQLLFKSKTVRPKDEQDFEDGLPLLDLRQRAWLRDALRAVDPSHAWLAAL